MAKLTKKQARQLQVIMAHLERAARYVRKPATIIAMQRSVATTTLDFVLPDGRVACEVVKEIGSDLAGLSIGIRGIQEFLEMEA